MKGGWDKLRNCARTLEEHDGNNEPLVEGDNNDDNKYGEDGDIPDNSALPADSIACYRPEIQRASVPSC